MTTPTLDRSYQRPGASEDAPRGRARWLGLAAFGAAVATVAALGSAATSRSVDSVWFERLEQPSFAPPNEVFAPIWTVLYVLMALAGHRAWRSGAPRSTLALWVVQLALILGWSVLFFGMRAPSWALVDLLALLVVLGLTIERFRQVDPLAALLLVPSMLWVGFATLLNATIVALN
jgi:translocator protein